MRFAVPLAVLCLSLPGFGSSRHKTTATSKNHRTSSKAGHSSARSRRGRATAHHSHPQYQAAPTPDRYREIQQALADKGYYKGPVTGEWNADSVDALRRFQNDHNLDGDGKLTSKSLILMGLGSKHEPVAAATPPAGSPVQTVPPGSTPNDYRSPEGSQRP
ncbi:MAG TPA: peptidoglycan-binding domain-containing protein [Bryobacteraceae bacterium]|nr:peptidoglycan-binding domain-containing protein [Bryobacteraceae bacterium]